MIREAIAKVTAGNDLSEAEAVTVMEELMSGEATGPQIGALLTALRIKGESVDELTGMARVMRAKVLRIDVPGDVLDVVSTGGGSFDPFNISTAAALICAAAGVRVAKHGNRGFTSSAGSADVLEALGVKIDLAPAQVQVCIEKCGFGFLFAPAFHPAMRHVGPARREIGIRTVFNSLGPLTNPAGAQLQLIGAGDAKLAVMIGQALGRRGTKRALVVHSEDGLDEISLGAPTSIAEVRGHDVTTATFAPEDAGFERLPLSTVKTGTPAENAERLRAVCRGVPGPDREYSLVNAGAALVVAGRAETVRDGARLAAETVDSGAALRTLDTLVTVSQGFGA